MDNKEWLKKLKTGDKFYTLGFGGGYNIYTVKRITNTLVITESCSDKTKDGSKFNRISGNLRVNKWYSETAEELTPEIIKKINIKKYIYRLNNFEFYDLDEDTLIQVYNIIFKKGEVVMEFKMAEYISNKNHELIKELYKLFDLEMAKKNIYGVYKGTTKKESLTKAMYYLNIVERLITENEDLIKN